MTSKSLIRNNYDKDPCDPNCADIKKDMEEYLQPLFEVHGSRLHGWGVAAGLEVTATLGNASLKVWPGTALDKLGRHIFLAEEDGQAETNPNADDGSQTSVLKPATDGVEMTTDLCKSGIHYVAIRWWEKAGLGTENIFLKHTPWIKLFYLCSVDDFDNLTEDQKKLRSVNPLGVDDSIEWVVLATVTLEDGGKVTNLTNEGRQNVSLPAGSIQLYRDTVQGEPDFAVGRESTPTGEICARPEGGIELHVTDPTDEIHLTAQEVVAHGKIEARHSDDTESLLIDPENYSIIGYPKKEDWVSEDPVQNLSLLIDTDARLIQMNDRQKGTAVNISVREGLIRATGPDSTEIVIDTLKGQIRASRMDTTNVVIDIGGVVTIDAASAKIKMIGKIDGKMIVIDAENGQITGHRSKNAAVRVDINTEDGKIKLGSQTIEGDRGVITLDGEQAKVVVGGVRQNGQEVGPNGLIEVRNELDNASVSLDGKYGCVVFEGWLIDPQGSHSGIGHGHLRYLPELVGGGFTKLHQHDHKHDIVGGFSRLGIIQGVIGISSGNQSGSVKLSLKDLQFMDRTGSGFQGSFSYASGFGGEFKQPPFCLISPLPSFQTGSLLGSRFRLSCIPESDNVVFKWDIAMTMSDTQCSFLILGPIV